MADFPYVIVVDGNGVISEHKVGNHEPGKVLSPTQFVMVSSKVVGDLRTVVLTRNLGGITPDHYTLDLSTSNLPFNIAIGSTVQFAYHQDKIPGNLILTTINGTTCICNNGVVGYIDGQKFPAGQCMPEPMSDLIVQLNPTCWVETYVGGLLCCKHENVLLDADQIDDTRVMELYLKFRFYYQPFIALPNSAPSHLSLHRFYFQTEAWAGEYTVEACHPASPPEYCIQEITAHWTGRDMLYDCDPKKDPKNCPVTDKGFQLIYAGGHCHAPSCLSIELYNADTGQLLCRQAPITGQGDPTDRFDELGYIALPPCLWGYEEGLVPPVTLSWDTKFMSIKRNNNTQAHYGEMASWQMRGIFL